MKTKKSKTVRQRLAESDEMLLKTQSQLDAANARTDKLVKTLHELVNRTCGAQFINESLCDLLTKLRSESANVRDRILFEALHKSSTGTQTQLNAMFTCASEAMSEHPSITKE